MARNITLSIVEATFNEVLKETEHISPKMIELIENKLQNECGDMRYKLVAYAASIIVLLCLVFMFLNTMFILIGNKKSGKQNILDN